MRFKIVYDTPGRLRVRCGKDVFSKLQSTSLEAQICAFPGVISAKASYANGGLLINYGGNIREQLLEEIKSINGRRIQARLF